MSLLIFELTHLGMLFGADRSISIDGSTEKGDEMTKVFKWPDDRAILGFVGEAEVNGVDMDRWLAGFMARNSNFYNLQALAENLREEIELAINAEHSDTIPLHIFHIGGFEELDGRHVPKCFFVTNVYGIDEKGFYRDKKLEVKCTEELWDNYFKNQNLDSVIQYLKARDEDANPFWLHQSYDLLTFNIWYSSFLRAMDLLYLHKKGNHPKPKTLPEWEERIRLQILMYDSYFKSFYPATYRPVGGDPDVVSLKWPS